MLKAQRRLSQELRNADVVLELRDARLPLGSGNPELERLLAGKPRLLVLNKASLAQPAVSRAWQAHFAARGVAALFLDADSRRGINLIFPPLRELTGPALERFQRRGMRPPPQRLMVVGMPNVGKSTFINRMIRENRLATAPTPGVTRNVTWVVLRKGYLLMDSPGIMLPRIDDEAAAHRLGWIGALPDAVLGVEPLATSLLGWLQGMDGRVVQRHYGLHLAGAPSPESLLEAIARVRGLLLAGGRPDLKKAAETLLHDFRAGRLGRCTLEAPPARET
jgi:ribosome biogenesis GTPase A